MKRVSYSVETKYKAAEMEAAGFSTKEIMKELNIRNRTQVKTWWRWYRNGESYRFSQHVGKQYTYGYRKITALINQCYTSPINHKRVQRIMQKHHLNCRVRPKKTTRIGKPYYKTDNLLQRQFKASCPMEVLTTDITYLPFGHSMLYLSSIMDIYNGEIVAYKIDDKQDQSLVNDTLNQIDIPEGCILHSDQGSVYTSYAYYQLCEEKSIIRSMSRKGTPADNAPIESFHSSLKSETFYINNELNRSNHIVIDIVEKYIKNYNNNRIQQKLGYLSPVKYRELIA
ncbi:IS3 family transposase [Staphylococcus epidermidis]|uniref:IS3 family transposase n=1 Tax=Staphylococcus epidermidis TaxID=1282 RepID=UPI00024E1DFA|nr:IS3 family transposase [Staphylococcus epidermidis]EHR84421.1 integrase core domain protein [Staphylococcus epidermidis VCU117]EHR92277.1 integrase core domain protein [Staphylococcus epidermidis VCU126]KAB2289812.1 IS3 family transposase [Staphylococcus epidermidis]MBM5957494.1 IS3 family transposase [Staphylococcus epidermidis]MBM5961887.1 IS3 family transposase [Staphylococcus epidermidis]